MVNVRFQSDAQQTGGGPRFNVLLTEDRPDMNEHWSRQLSRLLGPQGVVAYIARSGQEAIDLAGQLEIHAAVIDLATPLAPTPAPKSSAGGLWLLELFHRLPNRPPTVIVHNHLYTQRQIERLLREALRLGAFSVLSKPFDLEQLLRIFQRLVDRQYAGAWPPPRPPHDPGDSPPTPPRMGQS